ncbi:MAG: DUF1266 domain-containing protein [Sarcina sp.]
MFNKESYYFNLAIVCDATLAINQEVYDKILSAKNESKRNDLIDISFLSMDRNFMGCKFLKKNAYISSCKKRLKEKYNIKSGPGLRKQVESISVKSEYTKEYLAVEMFNYFDKSGKKFTSLEAGIIEYYRLIDLEIEEDMDTLKDYYKKSFYILSKSRNLFNSNHTYALEIVEVMDIIKLGYISSYIKLEEMNLYVKSFGREISERFNSWKEFYTSLILGLKLANTESDEELESEEIKHMQLILDEKVTPYAFIKFREAPREDINKIKDLLK